MLKCPNCREEVTYFGHPLQYELSVERSNGYNSAREQVYCVACAFESLKSKNTDLIELVQELKEENKQLKELEKQRIALETCIEEEIQRFESYPEITDRQQSQLFILKDLKEGIIDAFEEVAASKNNETD